MAVNNISNNYNNYNNQLNQTNSTLNRIATGIAINQASDDGSGLAIAMQLQAEGNSLGQAVENTNSGIAMMQISDNAINEQSNILNSVQEKLIQASTATTSADGRDALFKDIQKLMDQFDNIASQTNYNGTSLLQQASDDTNTSDALSFQAGTAEGDTINSNGIQANSEGVGLNALVNETSGNFTADVARGYLSDVEDALTQLNEFRAEIGSTTNQLESATRNLMTQETQTEMAKSIILDTDFAKESANFSSQNVISQAGAYSMAQANATQANVLRLLQ